ncbi:ethanolamine ammonia-lyase subunit EutC [Rhodococcus sp. G-MC3]|uniref:ethanolamine ammonia-lyase subunit EutC n=1 Tax=Rhodococcus sp. G-MC3 TaxID=3046209 RepID=UPI0024BB871E|nr:ethanolamine ammonia-lyase subunit EutC [Rhodococcus sp. G-MC3]MDJ0392793.1 ethanolamine ammonia-lyase subunit EutC [Rhodococcus sp. G-MC3]
MSDKAGVEPAQRPVAQFWDELRLSTQARIGLGRTGDSLPTRRVLEFRSAHAAARDAVHMPLEVDAFVVDVEKAGIGAPVTVTSKASSRAEYLRRPDLGREPEDVSSIVKGDFDIGFVLSDGLSPRALMDHGAAMLEALVTELSDRYSIAPPVVATEARVALGDHIAEAMGVRTVVVLIGERPGLSVADSLGIYLTHLPAPGKSDADRNCISNIHPPEGLGYAQSAKIVAGLVAGARKLGRSGVALKDTSRADVLESSETLTIE